MSIDMRKIYNFYPVEPAPSAANLPTGGDLYYECLDCDAVVNSVPFIKAAQSCVLRLEENLVQLGLGVPASGCQS
jgi:hypothetical protein